LTPHDVLHLIEAGSYREFLKRAFAKRRRFSYAAFARRAGIASRSFPRDVVLGKKRLSLESATRFAAALDLHGDLQDYFLTLVALEEERARIPPLRTPATLKATLSKLHARLRAKAAKCGVDGRAALYGSRHWLEVYAALGTPERGASLSEIMGRTGLKLPFRRLLTT
jgi:hypothetical protein